MDIRDLAGRFHYCQELAGKDRDAYMKKAKEAVSKATDKEKYANQKRELESARKQLEAFINSAGNWEICACIPVVNIVAFPVYIMASEAVKNARHSEMIAVKDGTRCCNARVRQSTRFTS